MIDRKYKFIGYFVTKEEEAKLATRKTPELDNAVKLIYILLTEDIPEDNIMRHLINNIVPKYEEKNLSNFY